METAREAGFVACHHPDEAEAGGLHDARIGAGEAYMDGRLIIERGDIMQLIELVRANAPWDKGGDLKPEVIVMDPATGEPVRNVSELLTQIAGLKPGVPADLNVLRRQGEINLRLTPGERPAAKQRHEQFLEMPLHRRKRRQKPLAPLPVQRADPRSQPPDRRIKIIPLCRQFVTPRLDFPQFVVSLQSHRPEPLAILLQPLELPLCRLAFLCFDTRLGCELFREIRRRHVQRIADHIQYLAPLRHRRLEPGNAKRRG